MDQNPSIGARRSVFQYLYRDAGNYKAFGSLLLLGPFDAADTSSILESCESDGRFVAEQLGIDALYEELYRWSGGPTEDDHVFHEFDGLREALPAEDGKPVWGTLAELVARFRTAKGKWNYALSPHWEDSIWGASSRG